MSSDVRLRVALDPDIHARYRAYAVLTHARLRDVHAKAIELLLNSRNSGKTPSYFIAPRETESVTLVITAALSSASRAAAEADGVSTRGLIHTALMRYYTAKIQRELDSGRLGSLPKAG